MADEQNPGNRDNQLQGDEAQSDRSKQKQADSKNRSEEQTDTLEDRNLSGSSTWANLPDQQSDSSSSDDDSTSNR